MPNGWTPAAASSTLEEWSRTFSRWQQSSCFRITVFYGVRAGEQKVGECDHWCTNRHRSTKTVPKTVKNSQNSQNSTKMTIGVPVVTCLPRLYQSCTNSVPKTVKRQSKQQKMTIGVPIVTGLPRLYEQCNKNLPVVNKNLAIANRASAAHTIRHS